MKAGTTGGEHGTHPTVLGERGKAWVSIKSEKGKKLNS